MSTRTLSSDSKCVWTRLSDLEHPLELHPVRFQIGCINGQALGAHPIYPDICPHCHKPVAVAASAVVLTSNQNNDVSADFPRLAAELLEYIENGATYGIGRISLETIKIALRKCITPETSEQPKNWAIWRCYRHDRLFAAHAGCSMCATDPDPSGRPTQKARVGQSE